MVFVTVRYGLKSKYGVYEPNLRPLFSFHFYGEEWEHNAVERRGRSYIIYNGHAYFQNGDFGSGVRANLVDVLSQEQLDSLFPLKTYKEWNNGGKEEIQEMNKGILGYKEEFDQTIETHTINSTDPTKEEIVQVIQIEPAKEKDLADIPLHELNLNSTGGVKHFDSGSCAICLEELVDTDIVRGLICGHVFHSLCVDPWLTERRGFCPSCKRDLYLLQGDLERVNQEQDHEEAQNDEPFLGDLDAIINMQESNPLAFYLGLCITKYKATLLLAAMGYMKLGNYSMVPLEERGPAPENFPQIVPDADADSDHPHSPDAMYERFNQPLINESDDLPMNYKGSSSPPLPDLTRLRNSIKAIIESDPRPFHPNDLIDLDNEAFTKTKRQYSGLRRLYFRILEIRWIDCYYFNVVNTYLENRKKRVEGNPNSVDV